MSNLLAISVGPVQEFIAAARRTRDLWFGSYLLSEISREVAKSVENQGGKLIFPASARADNVANIILAELPSGEPSALAAQAKQAAEDRWSEFAREAWAEASGALCPRNPGEENSIWDDQVGDVLEFYAAWVEQSNDYATDRASVMRLLSGRKNCRDFLPAKGRAGVWKSSLDGQRESVLRPPIEWTTRLRSRLRIRKGEQLDVVGLVKRVAGGTRSYPSVARIAADPWVRGNQSRLADVASACQDLGEQVVRRIDSDAHPCFAAFPFEGTAVFATRHHELVEETEINADQLGPLRKELSRIGSQPEPYLAVLVADGDKIGAALSRLRDADEHRAFSQALAKFAARARSIVEEQNGVLIYAGGDDVLGFLPVDKCLDCARALHDSFADCLGSHGTLTLSVGLAIGHFMENLEDLLEYGRAAERAAKQVEGKDALAVHLHKRGGAPIRVRDSWKHRPDERLKRYAHLLLAEAIPSKLPYELRRLADHYKNWDVKLVSDALRQDVLRVVHDKQPRAGRRFMPEIKAILQNRVSDPATLLQFAEELLASRQVATAIRQAGGSVGAQLEVAS